MTQLTVKLEGPIPATELLALRVSIRAKAMNSVAVDNGMVLHRKEGTDDVIAAYPSLLVPSDHADEIETDLMKTAAEFATEKHLAVPTFVKHAATDIYNLLQRKAEEKLRV
jgi:hypothetical protein